MFSGFWIIPPHFEAIIYCFLKADDLIAFLDSYLQSLNKARLEHRPLQAERLAKGMMGASLPDTLIYSSHWKIYYFKNDASSLTRRLHFKLMYTLIQKYMKAVILGF